ncbi:MAG: hypothetical protein U5K84_02525 [Alkalibacterium sp.]|nr:hypothetical protein [Alkalibacterium sp.]
MVVEDERDLKELKRWAKAGTQNETQLWMQINHPGKQSPRSLSREPVAPSAIPLSNYSSRLFSKPRALTTEEVSKLAGAVCQCRSCCPKGWFQRCSNTWSSRISGQPVSIGT